MRKKQKEEQEELQNQNSLNTQEPEYDILRKKTIKELIAPSGIDASNIDRLEILSNTTRYARSFFVSSLPRMCSFPELFRDMYLFGDINTSVYINPVPEARSQHELNRVINSLKRFSKEGAEDLYVTKAGEQITKWERKELRKANKNCRTWT